MTEMQAVLGISQMTKLDAFNSHRVGLARAYDERLLASPAVRVPRKREDATHIYQSYVVLLDERIERELIISHLREQGIETVRGTYAVHLLDYYRDRYRYTDTAFPIAATVSMRSLALPIHSGLSSDDVSRVTSALLDAAGEMA